MKFYTQSTVTTVCARSRDDIGIVWRGRLEFLRKLCALMTMRRVSLMIRDVQLTLVRLYNVHCKYVNWLQVDRSDSPSGNLSS